MSQKTAVNVAEIIDRERFSKFQIGIWLLCFLTDFFDGFDSQSIAFATPVIAGQWGISPAAFGPVFGAGLIGLTIGNFGGGMIADRFGRKNVTILCTLGFAIFTIWTGFANSLSELLWLRAIAGLWLGGVLPNTIAITAEFAPARLRATLISSMFCGFPLGAVFAGIIGSRLIPAYGWPSIFWLGGLVPLLLVPLMMYGLPESIRFLVTRGGQSSEVARLLNRICGGATFSADHVFALPEQQGQGFPVGRLFTEGRATATLLLWVAYFCNLLVLFFLGNWLPSVLRLAGVPVTLALPAAALFYLGGVIGGVIAARIIDKIGPDRVLTVMYGAAVVFTAVIGTVTDDVPLAMFVIFFAGVCVIGGQLVTHPVASTVYPTAIRSTGLGWALGIGRIGSIIGSVVAGGLLAAGLGIRELFFVGAVPAFIAAVAVYSLGRVRARARDAI